MKKLMLLFTILFLVTLDTACGGKKKTEDTLLTKEDANQTEAATTPEPTDSPAVTGAPTVTEGPINQTSEAGTDLYPAYLITDQGKKFGYINQSGAFVIDPVYDEASNFSENAAVVRSGETYQMISKDGKVLFENNYIIREIENGAAVFGKIINGSLLYGYVDTDGKVFLDPAYHEAGSFNTDQAAAVSMDYEHYSLIDRNGKVIMELPDTKEYIYPDSYKYGSRIFYGDDSTLCGVADFQNNIILEPVYAAVYSLGNGLYAARKPDEYGVDSLNPMAIFDRQGKQLTDYLYYNVNEFYGEYASASNDQHTFFIDQTGRKVEDLPEFEGPGELKLLDDIIQYSVDNSLFYYTLEGTLIWEPDNTIKLTDKINVKQRKLRPNRYVLIYYPELEGMEDLKVQESLNSQFKALFERDPESTSADNLTYVEDYYEVSLNGNLLQVFKYGYDYPWQAAHGMPIQEYYYFDLRTGKQYVLSNLFKKDCLYLSTLEYYLEQQILKEAGGEDSMYFTDSYIGITEDQSFILGPEALTIYFYPYEIAAYAQGFPQFEITYTDLSGVLDTEGELWNSFVHSTVIPRDISAEPELKVIMDTVIRLYEKALVNAINIDYFDYYVSDKLVENSSLYQSQKKLVTSLSNRNIREAYVGSSVAKVKPSGKNGEYQVYVTEEITIYYPDKGEVTKKYKYIYTVQASASRHRYQLSEIRKWE